MRQLLLIIIFLCTALWWGGDAQAQNKGIYQFEKNTRACLYDGAPAGSGISKKVWTNELFTARMVYCMRQLLNAVTKAFLNKITSDFGLEVLAASVLLAFGFYGLKVSLLMLQNPKSETFVFLLKVGFVLFVLDNTDFVVDFWFDTLDMFLELIVSGLGDIMIHMQCPGVKGMSGWFQIWTQFDCIFSVLVGFGKTYAGTGIIATAGLLMFAGSFGSWVAFMAIAAFYAVAQFLFRCAMIALLSYGGLALMLMLLPLMMPLILFKQTEAIFHKQWLPFAISFTLQPTICIAFMVFAMNVLDFVIMDGGSKIYVRYSQSTHQAVYEAKTYKKPPADAEETGQSPNKRRGINPKDSLEVQKQQLTKSVGGRTTTMDIVKNADNEKSYNNKDCGKLGQKKTAEGEVAKQAAKTEKDFEKKCTDPKKCLEAYQKNLPNAPSKTAASAARNTACDKGKVGQAGEAAQGTESTDSSTVSMITETLDLGADQEKELAQFLAYYGMLLITAGIFYDMMKYVPGIVNAISSSRSPNISLHSPSVAGKSLAKRFESGLNLAHQKHSNILANNKDRSKEKIGRLARLGGTGLSFLKGTAS